MRGGEVSVGSTHVFLRNQSKVNQQEAGSSLARVHRQNCVTAFLPSPGQDHSVLLILQTAQGQGYLRAELRGHTDVCECDGLDT